MGWRSIWVAVVVRCLVLLQLPFVSVPSRAHAADKWLLSSVDPHVGYVALFSEKAFATCVAPTMKMSEGCQNWI